MLFRALKRKSHQPHWLMALDLQMSATGHQVLSFVTSGEIRIIVPAVTRMLPALRSVIGARGVSCFVEVAMLYFSVNGTKARTEFGKT